MSKNKKKLLSLLMTVMMIINVVVVFGTTGSMAVYGADTNLALNKTVTCSSEQAGNEATHAVDGDTTNRWSAQVFPRWIIDAALGTYSYVTTDMDGQPRPIKDIGADEYSMEPVMRAPLTSANVGIFVP